MKQAAIVQASFLMYGSLEAIASHVGFVQLRAEVRFANCQAFYLSWEDPKRKLHIRRMLDMLMRLILEQNEARLGKCHAKCWHKDFLVYR